MGDDGGAAADTAQGPSSQHAQHATADNTSQQPQQGEPRFARQLKWFRSWLGEVHDRTAAINAKAVTNAKRLYVGNLPPGTEVEALTDFLNASMLEIGGQVGDEPSVLSCQITLNHNFAFVEFRTVEEATNALALDGVLFEGTSLRLKRPSNYDATVAFNLGPDTPDPTLDTAAVQIHKPDPLDSPNKLFVGGLPCEWRDFQVLAMLRPYGRVRAFNLVMDKATGNSKGYAFCEYEDDSVVDAVIAALNGWRVNTKTLTVKRAIEGLQRSGGPNSGSGAASPSPPLPSASTSQRQLLLGLPGAVPVMPSSTSTLSGDYGREDSGRGEGSMQHERSQSASLATGSESAGGGGGGVDSHTLRLPASVARTSTARAAVGAAGAAGQMYAPVSMGWQPISLEYMQAMQASMPMSPHGVQHMQPTFFMVPSPMPSGGLYAIPSASYAQMPMSAGQTSGGQHPFQHAVVSVGSRSHQVDSPHHKSQSGDPFMATLVGGVQFAPGSAPCSAGPSSPTLQGHQRHMPLHHTAPQDIPTPPPPPPAQEAQQESGSPLHGVSMHGVTRQSSGSFPQSRGGRGGGHAGRGRGFAPRGRGRQTGGY